MDKSTAETRTILYPRIAHIHFTPGRFYSCGHHKTEGKFVIYQQGNKVQLYGLLWSDDLEERKWMCGDWYDFDMKKIDYSEIPHWIFRAMLQQPWNEKLKFKDIFDANQTLVGGGYLTFNPWQLLWRTMHDRNFQKAPLDITRKCLEKESKVMRVEVLDEINERVFRYESSRHR